MSRILRPQPWNRPDRDATAESIYWDRRRFLKAAGFVGLAGLIPGCADEALLDPGGDPGPVVCAGETPPIDQAILSGVTPNPAYRLSPPRDLTDHTQAIGYNNFYEFTQEVREVWCVAKDFTVDPWSVEITGLTHRPRLATLEDILKVAPLEERVYRHRCVEAWAMTVPWVGYPLAEFIRWCDPRPEATHVRFVSAYKPDEMPNRAWIFPYYEGLRMDEAMNPLALLGLGLFGRELPKQNGAPLRLVLPWKYGFKSIKSIARVEFLATEPRTFWSDSDPRAYDFLSNVDPAVPHPEWSQATEELLGTGELVPTLKYNGYGEWVAGLYG